MITLVPTLAAVLLLAAIFVSPYPRHVVDERMRGYRSFVSFAAGISIAYVFIDLLPELDASAGELREAAEEFGIPLAEYLVHLAALLGFVLFYGLERLVQWSRPGDGDEEVEEVEVEEGVDFLLKVWGMAAYIGLVAYLIEERYGQGGEVGLAAYVLAMAFHFVAVRHSLRIEYPARYDAGWKWVPALACLVGWIAAVLFGFPAHTVAMLLGFLGGMLIMNTTVMELPAEKEGRFIPFVVGSLLYAALLMAA